MMPMMPTPLFVNPTGRRAGPAVSVSAAGEREA
jgi:hypothetical protein